ncbi:MAG: hypothetical protein ABIJ44_05325 [Pseudomonadota bacterium]
MIIESMKRGVMKRGVRLGILRFGVIHKKLAILNSDFGMWIK